MGLALENFDGIGRWRATEGGELIDASAEHGVLGTFDGVAELGDRLAASERATMCLIRNLYRHGTGHVEESHEMRTLEDLHTRFAAGGMHWRELLLEMAASPLFRAVGPVEVPQ